MTNEPSGKTCLGDEKCDNVSRGDAVGGTNYPRWRVRQCDKSRSKVFPHRMLKFSQQSGQLWHKDHVWWLLRSRCFRHLVLQSAP